MIFCVGRFLPTRL